MEKLKVLELFGGIGACSKALEKLGINYEIADYVEIDKYAVKSFNAMHDTNFEPQDICTWDKNIDVDLIMHGSPCQDFSVAGKGAGGDKNSGTRSSLMYETIRIVEKLKPKYVIWENVKNLLSKKHRHNFDAYLKTMEQLGYKNYYQVLNAKDYGIPQNRERVFTISIRNGIDKNFEFSPKQELKLKLKDMLEYEVDEKYYLSDSMINYLENGKYNSAKVSNKLKQTDTGICPTLDTMQGGNRQPFIEEKIYKRAPLKFLNRNQKNIDGDYAFCVDSCNTGGIKEIQKDNIRIRKLTPKECWRLMGFDDKDFERAEKVNSNTQLYKQAGNSIVVNVLMAIFKELL
jgi:DNA (cytosine-5)-methyltransferase 1